jgi:AGCS family alanine or glycine:cation symporter
MSQANTISESFKNTFGINKISTGLIVAFIAGLIIIGGVKRIVAFTSRMIPAMSAIYILGALSVILFNFDNLHESVKLIFSEAFAPQQAGAGFLGFLTSRALRFGIARGIFTHEAGLGSAPIAHAIASPKSPVEQGMWGIFEVFFDTLVVCTLTALAILTAGAYKIPGLDGINLTNAAFASVFGGASGIFLSVSILFFAVATLITWSFYGECCVIYLLENKPSQVPATNIYKIIFIILIVAGSAVDIRTVWTLSDIFNALMALPNMLAVIILSPAAYRETKKYLQARNTK